MLCDTSHAIHPNPCLYAHPCHTVLHTAAHIHLMYTLSLIAKQTQEKWRNRLKVPKLKLQVKTLRLKMLHGWICSLLCSLWVQGSGSELGSGGGGGGLSQGYEENGVYGGDEFDKVLICVVDKKRHMCHCGRICEKLSAAKTDNMFGYSTKD